ncbi:MAG: nucleotidyltransferase domain-containing protein [Defluviitaleaceae bacterium]|nr:nucleotidyltransferase domain-containing protein [Defluviitaleaceae bacterium]
MQDFQGVHGIDTATVQEFFRHMDEHPDIRLDFSLGLSATAIRRGAVNQYLAGADEAVKEMFPDLTDEEARFLYWSYVWATNSGLTFAEGQSRLAFGRLGAGAIMGLATSVANKAFTPGTASPVKGPQLQNVPVNPRTYIPQGISQVSFNRAVKLIRERAGHISNDIVVQGSRARGTARVGADIDFGVRVSPQKFDQLIKEKFGTPNPSSAKEKSMLYSIRDGRIFAGEAGFKSLKAELKNELGFGIKVQISIIKKGGPFDHSYFIIP